MSTITSIIDLKPFKTSWTIKVKIIRLWKQPAVGGGETIDMVLCDVKVSNLQLYCLMCSVYGKRMIFFKIMLSYIFIHRVLKFMLRWNRS